MSNVHLPGANITGGTNVGALVGENLGQISRASVEGVVTGDLRVGGLVGWNQGGDAVIEFSSSSARVIGILHVGGLAGNNGGEIRYTCSSGRVQGLKKTGDTPITDGQVGGLVGQLSANGGVSYSYSSADVESANTKYLGGLVGRVGKNAAKMYQSYSNGAISGGRNMGGLVGLLDAGNEGVVTSSYAPTIDLSL